MQELTNHIDNLDGQITKLVEENIDLKDNLNQVTAERDAAIKDLWNIADCNSCKKKFSCKMESYECVHKYLATGISDYEWRGIGKEMEK